MRRGLVIALLLAAVVLGGCGAKAPGQDAGKGTSAPGAAGKPKAVFMNSEGSEKKNLYENSAHRLVAELDGEPNYVNWYIEDLDGSHRKELREENIKIYPVWITDQWLYFTGGVSDNAICRVSLEGIGKDNTVAFSEKEILFSLNNPIAGSGHRIWPDPYRKFFVTDSYVLCIDSDYNEKNSAVWIKYDLQTKENTELKSLDSYENSFIITDRETDLPLLLGNSFLYCGKKELYRVDLDSLRNEKICEMHWDDEWQDSCSLTTVYRGDLYMADAEGVFRYDGRSGEIQRLADKDTLREALSEGGFWNGKETETSFLGDRLFGYEDKLYLLGTAYWDQKEKKGEGYVLEKWKPEAERESGGEQVLCSYTGGALLAVSLSDLDSWEYQENYTRYLREHVFIRKYFDEKSEDWKGYACAEGINGCAVHHGKVYILYLSGDSEEMSDNFAYDAASGTTEKIKWSKKTGNIEQDEY